MKRGKPADTAANVEVWKQIVSVQQHFNEIGWRIRSIAITTLTFTLGATFFGYLNAEAVQIGSWAVNPSALVPMVGGLIWCLFWFADGVWYHRLLRGAGAAAGPIEEKLKAVGIHAGLSTAIAESSHAPWLRMTMNSTRKLNIFYVLGIVVLLVSAAGIVALSNAAPAALVEPVPANSTAPAE